MRNVPPMVTPRAKGGRWYTSGCPVTIEIDRSVENFLAERGPGEGSVASRPELGPLAGELNTHWWREVERILLRVVRDTGDRAVLSPEERLLVDHGVLDWRLVPGGDKMRPALLKEIYATGRPNQYYFSEWILQRFRLFLLYGGMSAAEGEGVSTTRLIRDLRGRLYMRLTLLFKNLPGFNQQSIDLFVTGSGLARTYSVLLGAQQRIVKTDLDATLALAEHCDPMLPEAASLHIAPYAGGGFYEWDRDTLFVPLVPTREPEQAILQGLANYRILLDKFQDGGKFKKEYETALGGADDFGTSFVRDYRAWVNGVGKGFKGALDPARFAFFRDRIGPQPGTLYAPRGWVSRTPKELEEMVKACRMKVGTGEAKFEDYYRL